MKGIIMKIFYFVILFSLILLFFGCSKEDDKKTNFIRTADNSKLEGTWKTSCINVIASHFDCDIHLIPLSTDMDDSNLVEAFSTINTDNEK